MAVASAARESRSGCGRPRGLCLCVSACVRLRAARAGLGLPAPRLRTRSARGPPSSVLTFHAETLGRLRGRPRRKTSEARRGRPVRTNKVAPAPPRGRWSPGPDVPDARTRPAPAAAGRWARGGPLGPGPRGAPDAGRASEWAHRPPPRCVPPRLLLRPLVVGVVGVHGAPPASVAAAVGSRGGGPVVPWRSGPRAAPEARGAALVASVAPSCVLLLLRLRFLLLLLLLSVPAAATATSFLGPTSAAAPRVRL